MNIETTPKKILMLVNDTTFVYNLRREVLQRFIFLGHTVVVACKFLTRQKEIEALGVRLVNISIGRRSKNPFEDLKLFMEFLKLLRLERPNVVLTNNIKSNIYGGLACRILRIKYIPNITGLGMALEHPGLMQKLTSFLYKTAVAGAECIFFQNEENEKFFRDHHMISKRANTRLLSGSGVNLDYFPYTEYPSADNKVIFTFIGRLMKDKGIAEFISSAKTVKKDYTDVVFRCIGIIEDMEDHLLDDLNEACEYIEFTTDIRPYIAESQVIVLPSYHEGMANVLLEAAAMGRPVIASNVMGCAKTFDEDISGFSCQPRDTQSLIEAMLRFIDLPWEQKRDMGLAGRKKMEREFDRNIVVNAYIEEIEKINAEEVSHVAV